MELETDDIALEKCKSKIEEELGWGDSARWHTKDYETLSARIHERTSVTLSIATLKRLWGKIRYDSKPTPTTLNTLAQYLGYENWRSFRVSEEANRRKVVQVYKKKPLNKFVWIVPVVAIALIAFLFIPKKERKIDSSLFSFSSKKVIDYGVPNTVVFDYDATAASPDDSISIQQSWDTRLSRPVKRDQLQHTSVYYIPGFFEAKLVVNKQVVKEHNLLIKTDGWLPLVEQPDLPADKTRTPVYFKSSEAIHDGVLQLPVETIQQSNIQLQPVAPLTGYYNVRDFGELMSDDMVFETAVKNDYASGSNPCRYVEIRLQFEGPAVIIPLTSKGCVSNISIAGTDGTQRDLSAFGSDFDDWVKVKCVIKDRVAEIFVNDKSAIRLRVTGGRAKMVEVGYKFQGTGSVDYVKLSNNNGRVFFEDNFNQNGEPHHQ
ncbi:MAG: hypothetical protein WDO15_16890 [Bacteroidota bacterium]